MCVFSIIIWQASKKQRGQVFRTLLNIKMEQMLFLVNKRSVISV